MYTYKVKLKSDSGLYTVTILADSEQSAKERATILQGAPLVSVKSVTLVKKRIKKGDTVTIEGRRWFERVNGNTYHSARVYVNNELVAEQGFTYGYGDQYVQTGRALLDTYYKLPIAANQSTWNLRDAGIHYRATVSDVNRKNDL